MIGLICKWLVLWLPVEVPFEPAQVGGMAVPALTSAAASGGGGAQGSSILYLDRVPSQSNLHSGQCGQA